MRPVYTLILLILSCQIIGVHAQSSETQLQAVLDSIYDKNPTSIGVMIHVEAPNKQISWSGARGYSDKNNHTRLEADQPALIASNIKTFVSSTILRLVEEKKLSIDQAIRNLLSAKTSALFESRGYPLDSIQIKHLLTHTSGIQNYADQSYNDFINQNKRHRWTRDEQLGLTLKAGPPLSKPGITFSYTDANYLLLTEIIEQATGEPFFSAMRRLLRYDTLGLRNTWMPTLEEKPKATKALVHQYWGEMNWDSYDIDISIDLYGGGGIACTTDDLARFHQQLFNAKIVQDTTVLKQIFTQVKTNDPKPRMYYLGLSPYEYQGLKAYGHSGFWGTKAVYLPALNTSIAVFVLEKEMYPLTNAVIDRIVSLLKE